MIADFNIFDIFEFIETHATLFIIGLVVILTPVVLLVAAWYERCPKCKKRDGLELSGEREKFDGSFKYGRESNFEWKCKYCGYTTWRKGPN